MNKAIILTLCLLATLLAVSQARNYAVIVAGSFTYSNYRHQSDTARIYHTLRSRGFQESDIITFMYGDLPTHRFNPLPGTTYNEPSAEGDEGKNLHPGLKIDYAGEKVTPMNFLNALVGNFTGVGPVLRTTSEDNITLFLDDHGAPGLFAFPTSELYVSEFKAALDVLVAKKKAAKIAIYIEACESGSMCDGVIAPGSPIVCLTASDGEVSSWAKYCGPEATVNGVNIGSCLSNQFSSALAGYLDQNGVNNASIGEHFAFIRKETTKSPAQFFAGDESFKNWKLSDFFAQVDFTSQQDTDLTKANNQGLELPEQLEGESNDDLEQGSGLLGERGQNGQKKHRKRRRSPKSLQVVSSRDNDLHYLSQRYLDNDRVLSFEERIEAGEQLVQEVTHRIQADKRFDRIALKVLSHLPSTSQAQAFSTLSAASVRTMKTGVKAIECGKCCERAFKFISKSACKFTDYSLKYAKTIHNLCTIQKNATQTVLDALEQECHF